MPDLPLVTVGVVTRNRHESLRANLASLSALGSVLAEVIVVDDSSDSPVDGALDAGPRGRTRLIRQAGQRGPIVARNTIMREAQTEVVLLMDDDAALLPDTAILEAIEFFVSHPGVGSVAFAMAEPDGSPWNSAMQPAPVDYTCYVPAYIGFAHLVRRSVFLRLAGYRESFHFYGEEKDLCLRMLDAGYSVVYMPHVRVIHTPDPSGRNRSRYVRYAIRNDCLFALYNEPLPLPLISVPIRLRRYFAMSREIEERGGFAWIVSELLRQLPRVVAERRPVKWATMRRWRLVGRTRPAVA